MTDRPTPPATKTRVEQLGKHGTYKTLRDAATNELLEAERIEPRTRALPEHEREFWRQQRQALLMQIDAIERLLELNPRTAELRKDRR